MKTLITSAAAWVAAFAVSIAGCAGAYGDGRIWSNGWSLSDPDDVMFGVFCLLVLVSVVSAVTWAVKELRA